MRIIRLKQVLEQTGLGRSTLYKMIAAGTFPGQVSLGNSRSVGWVSEEVEQWVRERIDARHRPVPVRNEAYDLFRSLGY